MNIKQAEAETGISRRNIRFYEAQGLLRPQRNADNSYREYTDEDIRTLKLIRMLRMTDMPLEEIRGILSGSCPLSITAARHKERLIRRQEELLGAIRLCDGLQGQQIQTLDIDQVAGPSRCTAKRRRWIFHRLDQRLQRICQGTARTALHFFPRRRGHHAPGVFRSTVCLCQRTRPGSGRHKGKHVSGVHH